MLSTNLLNSKSYHTVIIGGGAAGLMCAATLLDREDFQGTIALIERNPVLGAKVIISGGGRCNVTTGITSIREVLTKYPRGADFLAPILKSFTPKSIYRWFESHGVPLKTESDLRVFPVSNNGRDIVGVFEKLFMNYNDRIDSMLRTKVESVQRAICSDGNCRGGFQITTSKGILMAQNIVIATGGQAYRHTGSNGDGYDFAQQMGHTVTQLGPSLSSLESTDTDFHQLSGTTFPKATIHLPTGQTIIGPVLCTHFGISGPATFVVSSHTARDTIDIDHPLTIALQPMADKDDKRWYNMLSDQAHAQPRKQLKSILGQYFPDRFVQYIAGTLSIIPIAQLNKDQKSHIAYVLGKGINLTITKRRPGDEFVTAGGVTTDEVNPHTCQSIIHQGLYFAGEVLDIDGYTGGFNLTSSWATGRRVGMSIK